jgi:RHS repeat-associated protein
MGRLIKDTDAVGGFTSLSRTETANGFVVTDTTAGGLVSTYEVDRPVRGEQDRIDTDSAGLVTTQKIHSDGGETDTSPDGTVVTIQNGPDPRWGMLAPLVKSLTVKTPAGLTETIAQTSSVTLANPLDPLSVKSKVDKITLNGQTYTTTFDATAHTITTISPAGRKSVTTVDSLDRPIEDQLAGVDPVFYVYDAQGRLISVTQGTGPGARTLTLTYNADNTLSTTTDALGQTVHLTYDAAGRLTQQTQPNGQVIGFGYDANGNLSSLTPPGRPSYTFTSTPVDLPSSVTAPSVGSGSSQTLFAYNLDRRLTQETLPDGQTVNLGYDSAGRLSTVDLATGQINTTYDAATGNLKSMTAPGGISMSYTYDGSLLTGETWTGPVAGSVTRTYDNNFRTSSLSVDGAAPISFQYDADGLLTQAGALALTYNSQNGFLTGTTLGSSTDAVTYDNFGDPATYTASQGGAAVYSVQYTYDPSSRISQKVETIGGATDTYQYTYDLNGQLALVQKNGSVVEAYTYDSNGNRLSFTDPSGTVTGTYDAQDQLLTYGSTSYSYDANGNLLSKTDNSSGQTTSYQYDALGNLLHVGLPNGTLIDYLVDGEGRRIGKEVNGVLVQGFLYQDGLRPIAELDGNGNVVVQFVYGSRSNVPDYMIKGGVTYRIISDQVGSPRLVVNEGTGQVVQRLDYDEFGNVLRDTNPGFQSFGFAGGLYDRDTGLVRFGARDYDARTGRWTAKDSLGFAGGDSNLYTYASNNPGNRIDPTGRFVIILYGIIIAGEALIDAAITAGILTAGVGGGFIISKVVPHYNEINGDDPNSDVEEEPQSCPVPQQDQGGRGGRGRIKNLDDAIEQDDSLRKVKERTGKVDSNGKTERRLKNELDDYKNDYNNGNRGKIFFTPSF